MNNREVIIQGEGILNLIPQRPPIVMVDSFFGIEKNHSYSGLTVTADNIFYETGKLQEAGIIEHIAQSAAARIGFLYTRQGEKVPLGFIGSVDKLKIYDLPKNGMKLFTEITVVQEVFDITLISAQVIVVVALLMFTDLGIYALLVAMIVYAIVVCVMNDFFMKKYLEYKNPWKAAYVSPLIASAVMGVVAAGVGIVIYIGICI